MTDQLLPLTPKLWSYEDAKKALWPEYILQSQVGNQVWAFGIPDPPGDTGMIANLDDLKAAGLEKVEKFSDSQQMLDYAGKLAMTTDGALTRAGLSARESNFGTYIYSYIADQGGQFWDNKTQKFDFNTPRRKAMQLIIDLFRFKAASVVASSVHGCQTRRLRRCFQWRKASLSPGVAPTSAGRSSRLLDDGWAVVGVESRGWPTGTHRAGARVTLLGDVAKQQPGGGCRRAQQFARLHGSVNNRRWRCQRSARTDVAA